VRPTAAIRRVVRRSGEVVGPHSGDQSPGILGFEKLRGNTHRVLHGDVSDELLALALRLRHEQVAHLAIVRGEAQLLLERAPEPNRLEGEPDIDFGRILAADPADRCSGRSRAQRVFLEQDDALADASLGEVIGDARTDDSATNNHDIGRLDHFQLSIPTTPAGKIAVATVKRSIT